MNNHSWQSIRLIFNLNILALFISEPMQSRKMNINDIKDEVSGGGGGRFVCPQHHTLLSHKVTKTVCSTFCHFIKITAHFLISLIRAVVEPLRSAIIEFS